MLFVELMFFCSRMGVGSTHVAFFIVRGYNSRFHRCQADFHIVLESNGLPAEFQEMHGDRAIRFAGFPVPLKSRYLLTLITLVWKPQCLPQTAYLYAP